MALLINKQLTFKGFTIPGLYIRLRIINNIIGDKIEITTSSYVSKLSYNDNPNSNELDTDLVPKIIHLDYNRVDEGNDILIIVHNKVKTYLSTDITREITEINPDTNKDETKTIIIKPKFCEESEISIVDID